MKTLAKKGLSILFLIIGLLIIQKTGYTQKKEIPNFIFAENARSTLLITSNIDFNKHIPSTWVKDKDTVDVKKEYSNSDEALWQEIVRVMVDAMKEVNLKPSSAINFDITELTKKPYLMRGKLDKEWPVVKPYYYISVSFTDENEIKKKFESQKSLTLQDIGLISLMIYQCNNQDWKSFYMIQGVFMDGIAAKLKEDIAKNPTSYFLKRIDETVVKDNEEKTEKNLKEIRSLSSLKKIGKEYETYPDDITEKKILVAHNFHSTYITGEGRKNIKWMTYYMDKIYKGNYKMISYNSYNEEIKKGDYKYVIFAISNLVTLNKTVQNKNIRGGSLARPNDYTVVEKKVFQHCFVVKNIETDEIYYGPEKEILIDKAQSNDMLSFRRTLKSMERYYSWK